jgi:DNA/RNA endonuclease G (NUC1)
VAAGPVFKKKITWLRSDSNKKAVPVAIPVSMFKIVVRKTADDQWDVLGFVFPQVHKTYAKAPFDSARFFKSVAEIERLTGQRFLSGVPNAEQIKQKEATRLWPVSKSDFDTGCDKQKTDVN